jgi:hypothetical protein
VPRGPDAGMVFLAQLTQGVDGVTADNDYGIWGYVPGIGLHQIVREGLVDDFGDGDETVKKIVAFKTVGGSPDHQRSGLTQVSQVLILVQTAPVVPPTSGPATLYRLMSLQK